MKYLTLIIAFVFVACSGTSSKQSESEEVSFEGTFVSENNTLIVSEYESPLDDQIEFQFDFTTSAASGSLFNYATAETADENSVTYTFTDLPRDQGGFGLEDLVMKFSYENDTWEVEDRVAINELDSARSMNLTGTYERTEAESDQ